MKHVIIYGGAFNPPTLAHQEILHTCIQEAKEKNGEIWILPSGSRSDKSIVLSDENRIRMLVALIGENTDRVKIEDYELTKKKLTETYDTVRYFADTYPDTEFTWVFGSDSINTMKEWKCGVVMWDELKMLIVNRPGHQVHEMPPGAKIIDTQCGQMSSTMVRSLLSKQQTVSHLVPHAVLEVIREYDIIY